MNAVPPRPDPDQRSTPVSGHARHSALRPHADDTTTSCRDGHANSEGLAPIDPADVMPVVFIAWNAPGEDRPSDDHVCDGLCVDDDPPEDDAELTLDDGRSDGGLG